MSIAKDLLELLKESKSDVPQYVLLIKFYMPKCASIVS